MICLLVMLVIRYRRGGERLWLVSDENGNEALVMSAVMASHKTMFMIDTAYAGAPVLSTSFLSVQDRCTHGDMNERYRACIDLLRNDVTNDARNDAIRKLLLVNGQCQAYTSGCTMRLMGIGETSEAQSDMLLCPALVLGGHNTSARVNADIFVTNPLQGSPHILTTDYLLQRSPCVLCPHAGRIYFRNETMGPHGFEFHPPTFVGGAFVVTMIVGGASLNIVMDTGASAALSLSSDAIDKLETCQNPTPATRAIQRGVNGERVCSDVLITKVRIGTLELGVVHVFANSHPVQGADGYAGMGLLRAVDMWLEPTRIGFRRSGLPVSIPTLTSNGSCPGRKPPRCAA